MNRRKFDFRTNQERKVHDGPQQLNTPCRLGTVLRFQAQADATDDVIMGASLASLMYVATGATSGVPIMESFKIRKVEAWAPPLVGDASYALNKMLTIYTGENGGYQYDPKRTKSSIVSGSHGAYVVLSFPQEKTLAGKWHNTEVVCTGSDDKQVFFGITCPKGTIIDVHISYQVAYESDLTSCTVTTTGLTAGRLYWNYLDSTSYNGASAGTQNLMPIGPPSSKINAAYSS